MCFFETKDSNLSKLNENVKNMKCYNTLSLNELLSTLNTRWCVEELKELKLKELFKTTIYKKLTCF
jgi:hypothetical protein